MLIAGIWHGAGWTFIIWGAYHGVLLTLNHMLEDAGIQVSKTVGRLLSFVLVTYGWVFFRSTSVSQALSMTRGLFGLHGLQIDETYFLWKHQFFFLLAALFVALWFPNAQAWSKKISPNLRWGVVVTSVLIADLLLLNRESVFLYFQF